MRQRSVLWFVLIELSKVEASRRCTVSQSYLIWCYDRTKLMRLGTPNRIVVFVDLNRESEFDCRIRSDSDFNEEIVSTIVISIKFQLYSLNFDLFLIIFWLKEQKWSCQCRLFNWKWSNLIKNVKINQKSSRFWLFLIKFNLYSI